MESGAKGCEVIVSGKLRAQRAKAMKFKDGFMVSSGEPVRQYIDSAVRHVMLRQGVLGIKVKPATSSARPVSSCETGQQVLTIILASRRYPSDIKIGQNKLWSPLKLLL